jgi:polyphosphate glucokinase
LSQELREPLEAEHVVLSGGNAKKLKHLPANIISGSNQNAFLGGRGKEQALK